MTSARDWQAQFDLWLTPFLARLSRKPQRRWAPVYLQGLLGPGERKSVEPMAARVAPGDVQQLHHFVSTSPWQTEPLEEELVRQADRLLGGPKAVLVIDDTALVKQGRHSVGVARQYCGQLGKTANCQVLVSLTLARAEVPVCVALRLFLPESWAADETRRARAGVPQEIAFRPKWQIALAELDRIVAAGARFGCVLADAEYGKAAEFRAGLSERERVWAVGILPTQKVYPADVRLVWPTRKPRGRPARHPLPSVESQSVQALFAGLAKRAFRTLSWRTGSKGALRAAFAARRVRVADGPAVQIGGRPAQHLPGQEEVWLVCEERSSGERKYYLSNLAATASLTSLAAAIKARWVCEQMHQQMKEELGLDHFEGRSWRGLQHHALMCQLAYAFLQHLRLSQKNVRRARRSGSDRGRPRRAAAAPELARGSASAGGGVGVLCAAVSALPSARPLPPPTMKMAE
jgi:SRSO17 transposase